MQIATASRPAYNRECLRTLLSPHRIPLAWFEPPSFSAGILEAEYIKATSNAALIALEASRLPDDDKHLSGLHAAHAAEQEIASAFMELIRLRMTKPN